MAKILFGDSACQRSDDESILDCLDRHNQTIPHSCKSGVCQTCMLQAVDVVPGLYQEGLTPQQKEQGYFLPCQSRNTETLTIASNDSVASTIEATVVNKKHFNQNIFSLTLDVHAPDNTFKFKGGQFINVLKDESCIRSYSIANPQDIEKNHIELHIKRYSDGVFSKWAHDTINTGDTLQVQSPLGKCYYIEEHGQKPLQLFAMGTGLAPIVGVLRTALAKGHHHPIRLLVGAKNSEDFYYQSELGELCEKHANLSVSFIAQTLDPLAKTQVGHQPEISLVEGDFYTLATTQSSGDSVSGFDKNSIIFICGAESFVTKLRKKCFLAGTSFSDIHADIFLPSGNTS